MSDPMEAVKTEIAEYKAKLKKAEEAGDKDLILLYGGLLKGVQEKENKLMPSGSATASAKYWQVTGTGKNTRKAKGVRRLIYDMAQTRFAFHCDSTKKASIYYSDNVADLHIRLLFKDELCALGFQNDLLKLDTQKPVYQGVFDVDEDVPQVNVSAEITRVLVKHYQEADNPDSPAISLADHLARSTSDVSVCYDPVKQLQSFENMAMFPGSKFYWCHLVSRKVQASSRDESNRVWASWLFHQYLDALNVQTEFPLLAVEFQNAATEPHAFTIEGSVLAKYRVNCIIKFYDSALGHDVAKMFEVMMKEGSTKINDLTYRSFVHVDEPEDFTKFLKAKYKVTMKAWGDPDAWMGESA